MIQFLWNPAVKVLLLRTSHRSLCWSSWPAS